MKWWRRKTEIEKYAVDLVEEVAAREAKWLNEPLMSDAEIDHLQAMYDMYRTYTYAHLVTADRGARLERQLELQAEAREAYEHMTDLMLDSAINEFEVPGENK